MMSFESGHDKEREVVEDRRSVQAEFFSVKMHR